MNIGVIGVGGVGGYFGAKLARLIDSGHSGPLKVYFIARGSHLEAIRKDGLVLSTPEEGDMVCRPTLATDDFGELPPLDLCLVCVKSYDLNGVLAALKGRIKEDTDIIAPLNGVDIYERIRSTLSAGTVYPSCVYVGTQIEKSGRVAQKGGSCTISLGRDPARPESFAKRALGLFDASGIKYRWLEDPYTEIWTKYMFICAYGIVAAAEGKTLGQILESRELGKTVRGVIEEIAAVARKKGVALAPDAIESALDKAREFPYETKTSFQRDFERKDRPDERELFADTVIRLSESLGMDAPVTRLVKDRLG